MAAGIAGRTPLLFRDPFVMFFVRRFLKSLSWSRRMDAALASASE
jgi:hypothetical protein